MSSKTCPPVSEVLDLLVCMCVCMYVYLYVCMYMYVCMYAGERWDAAKFVWGDGAQ